MVESPRSSNETATEFRADPGAHWPAIITFCALALLSVAGAIWLIIKPGPVTPGRILTALFLAFLAVLFVAGAWSYWLKLQRLFCLRDSGLEFFDGRQTHDIRWDQVAEIYEMISSVKLLGFTVDAPQFRLAVVTTDGIRCEIDKDIQGSDRLAPIISCAVNQRLSDWARRSLGQHRPLSFGCLTLSEAGILITAPQPVPWWQALRRRFESQVGGVVVVPGEYAWQNIRDLRIARAIHGSRLSDHTVYNQVEIHVQGRQTPVYACAVSEAPNFAVLAEVLDALGYPLRTAQ